MKKEECLSYDLFSFFFFPSPSFFTRRNLAVIGALMLLLAETYESARDMFAGVPSMGGNKTTDYLQV